MALLTENNRQYYEGAQSFRGDGVITSFTTTFNTALIYDASNTSLNNFKLYESDTGTSGTWSEVTSGFTVSNSVITYSVAPVDGKYIVVQLNKLDGGNYGSENEKAYGTTVEKNYGSYAYISLNDIINNFIVAYVGNGKLIPSAKRTDVIFHAKRGLQEFSYDTLKSIKSQELTVPTSLSIPLPQDYVNYTSVYRIDESGAMHIIMPANNITTSPYTLPVQDTKGVPTQDSNNNDIQASNSITEDRWKNNDLKNRLSSDLIDDTILASFYYNYDFPNLGYGELYGLEPQYANVNGYWFINERENKMSFSNDLVDKVIVFEYISDGLAIDLDTRIPKMAEEALYAHISHAIIASRINQPEYIVQRLKRERSAKLRNAKIRLSNIKLNEFVQVTRGKSKWIKH